MMKTFIFLIELYDMGCYTLVRTQLSVLKMKLDLPVVKGFLMLVMVGQSAVLGISTSQRFLKVPEATMSTVHVRDATIFLFTIRTQDVIILHSQVDIIRSQGYVCNIYQVTTEDGYILEMHRIGTSKGRPVLLQHGLLSTDVDWLTNPTNQSLGAIRHRPP